MVGEVGERKQLTVLFADVLGSMDVQENLDAEGWAGIMGRLVAILAEGVRRFGGTVDKFTGDGIMALFGAPFAQEDHARRACHAAWHITAVVASYTDQLRRDQDVDLKVRVGLNSGEVVVGRVGDDVMLDPTALGHAVGLAQRMEAMAEPGRAYLTEHTARLIEGWFVLEDLGPQTVKGARQPLGVYVLGRPFVSSVTARAASTLGASPLVGRERELAGLQDALAEAIEGRFQVVGVVGEAGMGKSRLCEEFVGSAGRGITVRRTTGVSHGRSVPLLPVLSLLRDYFSITDTDTPPEARDKVTSRLLALDPGLDEILPLLLDFLEVPAPERPAPGLDSEVRMHRVLDALHRITTRRSEHEVLVLLVEDLHWFDPQSDAFLERLIESFPGSRTLVVTNFRPEFSARWMRHSYYRQLPLAPLGAQAVGDLLGGLVGTDPSLAPLRGFVLERTGGNPFFVEEVVRALVEDGTLADRPGHYQLTRPLAHIRVPPTIQATLAARIDRLSAEHKAVLQAAAVIGRAFPVPVLAGVTDVTYDVLEDAMRALCGAELLQETVGGPVGEYRFWHPLTQEVAYDSLLAGRRAQLHTAVAETLAKDEQRAGERAGVIAWHWERAGRPVKAARWNFEAGKWALRSDLGEAQRRWRAAIDLLDGAPVTDEGLYVGSWARNKLCQFGARTGIAPEEAERLYTEARVRAEQLDDPKLLALVVAVSGSNKFCTGDLRGGLDRYLEGAQIAEQTGDRDLQAACWHAPALPLVHLGPLAEGLAWIERHLAICADDPDRGVEHAGYSPLTSTVDSRARYLLLAGRLPEAARNIDRAVALGRLRAEPDPLCWALTLAGRLAWLSGEGEGLAAAAEAVQIGEETGNIVGLVLGLQSVALSELSAGRPSRAVAACERALREVREHRTGLFEEGSVLAHLARARLAAGDPAGAVDAATDAVTVAVRQQAKVVHCLALLTRAQTLRATDGDVNDISADLDAALALVSETGAVTYEPFIREEFARLRGDPTEMGEALRLYSAIGAIGHARRLHTEPDVPTPQGG